MSKEQRRSWGPGASGLAAAAVALALGCGRGQPIPARDAPPETTKGPLSAVAAEPAAQRGADAAKPGFEALMAECKRLRDDRRVGVWSMEIPAEGLPVEPVFRQPVTPGTAEALVRALNAKYPPPEFPGVRLKGRAKGSVRVEPLNADLLTQGMGTSGAEGYLGVVTWTLTSLKGVDSVEFEFEEGDHAVPGRYDRRYFREGVLERTL